MTGSDAGSAASAGTTTEPLPAIVPLFSVVKGDPTPEEIGALVTVLLSTGSDAAPPAPAASGWSDRRRSVRVPLQPGPGAWRLSGR